MAEAENIYLYRHNPIPSMIELNVGYLASSPRILATMQTMRMANWINKKKSKICDDEFIFIGIGSKN